MTIIFYSAHLTFLINLERGGEERERETFDILQPRVFIFGLDINP